MRVLTSGLDGLARTPGIPTVPDHDKPSEFVYTPSNDKSIPTARCGSGFPAERLRRPRAGVRMAMPAISSPSEFREERLRFTSDGLRIEAVLHRPHADAPPVVIGSHGLFSDGDSPKQVALAQALNAMGIAFMRLDHRGCGHSEGAFDAVTTLAGRVSDLVAAVGVLGDALGNPLRLGLFGSSLGGSTCLAAASELKPARMVTLAAPADSRSLLARARQDPSGQLPPVFASDALQFDLSDRLASVDNLLVIHGEADDVVPVAHARRIYAASREPKRLMIQPGGDHRVTAPDHQRAFIQACRDWFAHLRTAPARKPSPC